MAARRSTGPYIWATTLPRLLTGENSCEWAGWFKAHHQNWTKTLSDFDQAKWMLDHTALVNQERERMEELGYTVRTENQNTFRLIANSATLAGKPDLIAGKGDDAVVVDAKRGSPAQPSLWRAVHVLSVRCSQGPRRIPGDETQR